MSTTVQIRSVSAYQVYDSRGVPTVECEVALDNGASGRGVAPSGASTGRHEAHELRDGDPVSFRGKSVYKAIDNVHREIAPLLRGKDATDQTGIDRLLIHLDGTENKERLGANAVLPVSMAVANAAAAARKVPLFESLGNGKGDTLPLPEIQIFGGGAHANWRTDIQDFLVIATGARSYEEALEISHNIYHAAGDILKSRGALYGIADEGGFWPEFDSNEAVFAVFLDAVERAGYIPGKEAALSLDIAASDLYDEQTGLYRFRLDDRTYDSDAFAELMVDWCDRYPVVSIEDPLADTDWDGWAKFRKAVGERVQVIGDDLFTTNPARIRKGIAGGTANAVLIKLNQVGTVSETLEAIRLTREAGWNPVVSARSGETEDTFIAHLAVATNAGQLKVGSFARSERMAKWNEVLRIRRRLGDKARFRGAAILPGFQGPAAPPV